MQPQFQNQQHIKIHLKKFYVRPQDLCDLIKVQGQTSHECVMKSYNSFPSKSRRDLNQGPLGQTIRLRNIATDNVILLHQFSNI